MNENEGLAVTGSVYRSIRLPVGRVGYELLSAGIFGTDDDGPFTIRRVEIMARFPTRAEARAYMIETTAERRARDIDGPSEGGS